MLFPALSLQVHLKHQFLHCFVIHFYLLVVQLRCDASISVPAMMTVIDNLNMTTKQRKASMLSSKQCEYLYYKITTSLLLAAIMILSRLASIFCKRYFVTINMKVPSYE